MGGSIQLEANIMANEIEKVSWRARAKPRRSPYWRLYTTGRYLGWRKMTAGSPGTWLAKAWDGEKYPQKALGDFANLAEEQRYSTALAEATKWFHDHLDKGGSTEAINIKAACENYVDKLRTESGDTAADDAAGRFRRLVYGDPLAKMQLSKLKPAHLADWKKRVLVAGGARSSYNRNSTALRAALNLAHARRNVASDFAWAEELRPLEGATARRRLYLDRAKRRQLVEKASAEARPLFATLNMLPMRSGEVAALRVEHLKPQQRAIEIPTGKTEARVIPLTAEALVHFKACAKGKLPSAWLIARADGSQWKKEAWRDEIKAAARKAKLPKATVAYTLRHSVITDLITDGLDLFTVAKLAGTSVVMIEKHYGHLQREHARRALEKLALA
jgi:site-specific recombinase XerD